MIAAALAALTLVAPAPAPARVQVTATEYELRLSRLQVKAGPAVVELVNFGEDAHDLLLRKIAPKARTHRIRKIRPGRVARVELRLYPGRYRLWCSVGGHAQHGMRATLAVVKRKRATS